MSKNKKQPKVRKYYNPLSVMISKVIIGKETPTWLIKALAKGVARNEHTSVVLEGKD